MLLVKDNPYIPSEDRDFFILLRIGLWQKVEEELSSSPDWDYIYKISCEQTVQGIVCDGISLYRNYIDNLKPETGEAFKPETEFISQEQYDKFLSSSAQIIRQNYKVNNVQAKICDIFNNPPLETSETLKHETSEATETLKPETNRPLQYVVMKGQAVAQCYPKPNLRISGDIDFFFPESHYELAKTIIEKAFGVKGDQNPKWFHYITKIDGIDVELHGPEKLNFGKRISNVMQGEFNNMITTTNRLSYDCNGTQVHLATPEYTTLYLFMHCLQHFYVSGLGLRQICDWAIYLNANFGDMKLETRNLKLSKSLSEMKLSHAFDVFSKFAIQYLGKPETCNLEPETTETEPLALWALCKASGNMGHSKDQFLNQGFILRNINTIRQRIMISQLRRSLSSEIDNFMWLRIAKEYNSAIRRRIGI